MTKKNNFLKILGFLIILVFCISVEANNSYAEPSLAVPHLIVEGNKNLYDLSSYMRVVEGGEGAVGLYKALGEFINGKSHSFKEYKFNKNNSKGYWLILRIRNSNLDKENWVLDLGRNVSNSIGISNIITLYSSKDFSDKILIDGRYISAKKHVEGQRRNAVPLHIVGNSTETLAFYIEPLRSYPFRISPRLVEAELFDAVDRAYFQNLIFLFTFIVVLLLVCMIFYIRWGNLSFIALAIYTIIFTILYGVSDEVIPYGNNSGAVFIDVITVFKYIVALALSYLLFSRRNYEQKFLTLPKLLISTFVLAIVYMLNISYNLNQYSALIIFGYLSWLIPFALIVKSLQAFIKTIKTNFCLIFSLSWMILISEAIYSKIYLGTIYSGEYEFYFITQLLHIVTLYIAVFTVVIFKNNMEKVNLKQQKMRQMTEDEIKRTYQIVSRDHLLEVVQRERDLLLDLKRHDSEIMQEEREEKDAKIKFLAMISHEIRTPMTGIMGIINLLNGTSLTEQQREYVDTLHQTGNALLLMLNDILDLSKAESGKMQLEYIDFDIRETVKHVVNIMEPFAHGKGIALNVGVDKKVPNILVGDPSRLRQILTNLVSNAIKFTEAGYVNVILRHNGTNEDNLHNVLFIVEDTGVGIPEDMQQYIFEPYAQAGKSVTRKFGGTGLGLAICYQLVNQMNGKISLNSIEGKGSTFYFTIPMQEGGEAEVVEEIEEGKQQSDDNKVNILLVDDNDANRKIMALQMKQNLGKRMGELMTAANGIETMNLMSKYKFDIVFMDLEMPDFSGIDVTGMIRKMSDKEKARTPIIAMTAHRDQDIISKCIQSGMNDFIEKPLDLEKLSKIINVIAEKDKLDAEQLGAALGEIRNERVPEMDDEEKAKHKVKVNTSGKLEIAVPEDNVSEEIFINIKKSMPIEDFKKLLFDLYKALDNNITEIDKAVKSRKLEQIKFYSHSIAGVAENFGFNALGYMARKVYKHADNNDEIEVIKRYVDELSEIYKETRAEAEELV